MTSWQNWIMYLPLKQGDVGLSPIGVTKNGKYANWLEAASSGAREMLVRIQSSRQVFWNIGDVA